MVTSTEHYWVTFRERRSRQSPIGFKRRVLGGKSCVLQSYLSQNTNLPAIDELPQMIERQISRLVHRYPRHQSPAEVRAPAAHIILGAAHHAGDIVFLHQTFRGFKDLGVGLKCIDRVGTILQVIRRNSVRAGIGSGQVLATSPGQALIPSAPKPVAELACICTSMIGGICCPTAAAAIKSSTTGGRIGSQVYRSQPSDGFTAKHVSVNSRTCWSH